MAEIITRLQHFYNPEITRSATYRALHRLEKSESTVALVRPLDPDARPHLYSAEAAQRIARCTVNAKPPTRFIEPVPEPKQRRKRAALAR